MATRPRRTRPPENMGATRPRSMRNNTKAARPMPFQQQTFQGGIGQNAGAAPQQPGLQRPGQQQSPTQCPAGQKPGKTPDGRMGCVPDTGPGQIGAPRRPGAGIPGGADRNKPNRYNEGS